MLFKELTPKGEELLKEILEVNESDSDRKSEHWHKKFNELTHKDDSRIRSIFSELKDNELLKIMWADNIPYIIEVTNYGYTYFERKQKYIKEEKRLKRREWKIAIISAIVGGLVGLIPYIITLIK
ncbi:hypothetical protein [Clostridium sp.]|uniref:hypothetical protein n=1 Tax=Clostridium sp. TaxID=1506 RepID=UPI001E14AE71|nr:hypothetical protein [Clostridium sp.]MBS5937603.1 hypothetical protein [Clostridium sp.]